MNKTDRMLAILLELQRHGMRRAEDLAAGFETSVRTIYRDMQALSEAGVPIVGAPGQGYSLAEGYFLPPVSFTAEEAVTLLIGGEFVIRRFDAEYARQAESSRSKIEAILPAPVREEAVRLRGMLKLLGGAEDRGSTAKEKELLGLLRRALMEGRKVRFRYAAKSPQSGQSRISERTVMPYGLVDLNHTWMLAGYCELRREMRHFRLSRMSDWELLHETYSLPDGFDFQRYKPKDDRSVIVRVRLHPRLADSVKESSLFYLERLDESPSGLTATFRVNRDTDLLQWVLGCGADAAVLEPESLRQRVREEILRMLESY